MSTNNSIATDPAVELAEIRARGANHLAELRREHAERRAELDRIDAEERSRLSAAEAAFAADLEIKEREIRITQARASYAELENAYSDAARHSNDALGKLNKLIAGLADAYRDALNAELNRVEVGEEFRRRVHKQLSIDDPSLAMPNIDKKRLVTGDQNITHTAAAHIAAAIHGQTVETTANQLRYHTPKRFGEFYMSCGERVYFE